MRGSFRCAFIPACLHIMYERDFSPVLVDTRPIAASVEEQISSPEVMTWDIKLIRHVSGDRGYVREGRGVWVLTCHLSWWRTCTCWKGLIQNCCSLDFKKHRQRKHPDLRIQQGCEPDRGVISELFWSDWTFGGLGSAKAHTHMHKT